MTCGVPLEFLWIKFGAMKRFFSLHCGVTFHSYYCKNLKKSANNETFLIPTGYNKFSLQQKCGGINDAAINLICVF